MDFSWDNWSPYQNSIFKLRVKRGSVYGLNGHLKIIIKQFIQWRVDYNKYNRYKNNLIPGYKRLHINKYTF
jgi:hypothetical protein